MITVEQLPDRPTPGVFLFCSKCRGEFSATRGDYFQLDPTAPMKCCEVNLHLVRRESKLVELFVEPVKHGKAS